MKEGSATKQYLAAITANLITVSFGIAEGFPSPAIFLLTSDDSPLPSGKISMEEASWFASLLFLGCSFGNLFFGYITNKCGRKWPIIITAIPTILSWLLVLFAQNVYYLYISRFLTGFFCGGTYTIVPLFLSEISQDHVRGTVTSSVVLMENVGFLIAFVLGAYCDLQIIPMVVIILLVLGAVLLYPFPESAIYLMKQGKTAEAENSIIYYQNLGGNKENIHQIEIEMDKLRRDANKNVAEKGDYSPLQWSDFTKIQARKAFGIGLLIVGLNQFAGVGAMMSYTSNIFKDAGSNLSPNVSAIIIGIIQIIGSIASTYLVDRAGRKILYAISTIGSALGLSVLGCYTMFKSWGHPVEDFNWIPLVSFSTTLFVVNLAIFALPVVVLSEVMPEKVKDFALSTLMTLLWFLNFGSVKVLPLFTETIGFHFAMFVFAGVCLIGFVSIYLFVPETKGKSYEEIMRSLE